MTDAQFIKAISTINRLRNEIAAIEQKSNMNLGGAYVMVENTHTAMCQAALAHIKAPSEELLSLCAEVPTMPSGVNPGLINAIDEEELPPDTL